MPLTADFTFTVAIRLPRLHVMSAAYQASKSPWSHNIHHYMPKDQIFHYQKLISTPLQRGTLSIKGYQSAAQGRGILNCARRKGILKEKGVWFLFLFCRLQLQVPRGEWWDGGGGRVMGWGKMNIPHSNGEKIWAVDYLPLKITAPAPCTRRWEGECFKWSWIYI